MNLTYEMFFGLKLKVHVHLIFKIIQKSINFICTYFTGNVGSLPFIKTIDIPTNHYNIKKQIITTLKNKHYYIEKQIHFLVRVCCAYRMVVDLPVLWFPSPIKMTETI